MRAVVCVLCVLTLTALCRRHFQAIAQPSSAEERAELRDTLHAFGPAIGDAGICAAFGTQLVLQPGSCDSASYNRKDSADRSYKPEDGNVEVSLMVVLCCVYICFSLTVCTAGHVHVCQLFVGQHAARHATEPEDVSAARLLVLLLC